ncbi:hypothetical protein E2562_010187, partial [Oryza meyeriana var. granulata]
TTDRQQRGNLATFPHRTVSSSRSSAISGQEGPASARHVARSGPSDWGASGGGHLRAVWIGREPDVSLLRLGRFRADSRHARRGEMTVKPLLGAGPGGGEERRHRFGESRSAG